VHKGVLCAWTDETGASPLPPEEVSHGRARAVNGTISSMPLFGLMLAGAVVKQLLEA